MKKKPRRRMSVLLIPEDQAEPYSFRIGMTMVKVLLVVGAVLVLHVIGGGLSYWQLAKTRSLGAKLKQDNKHLVEDNKRVYQLASQLEEMVKEQEKIRNLLGVEPSDGTGGNGAPLAVSGDALFDEDESLVPIAPRVEAADRAAVFSGNFLAQERRSTQIFSRHLPTLLPVEGFLTTTFSRNNWHPFKAHAGIDIAARRGSVVCAAGEGQVVFANWTLDLGNLIIIYHGDDLFTYYGHNDRLLVAEKTFVKKGAPIALLGSSGKSSGPHLHFEIWSGGAPVDPRQYLLAFQSISR